MRPNKKEMQKEWDEYGSDAFNIEILETLEKKPEQEEKECQMK